MKSKATKMIGIGFLVAALAVPSVVLAHGWGRGHMMDNWGMGPGAMTPHDRGYSTLTPEQRTQLDQLHRRFYEETADLRKDLWNKSAELNTLLSATDPDLEKVKTLNKEINDLRAKLDEKSLNYQLEARKVTPDTQFGDGYGRFHRPHMRGFGRGGMMGYGPMGSGPMGYGAGNCWY